MSKLKHKVGFSSVSLFLQVYTGSIILILLAKYFHIYDYGELIFGISLSSIIATCSEFGYSLMTLKDVPQKKFRLNEYVYNVLFQKHVISFLVFFVASLYIYIYYLNDNFSIKMCFIIDGIILSYTSYFISLFQALGSFKDELLATILNALLISLLLFAKYNLEFSFEVFCILFISCHFIRLVWVLFKFRHLLKNRLELFSKTIQSYLVKNSWTYGIHYIIGVFYFTIDTQIIFSSLGKGPLAIYSSAFRVITSILLISNVFNQVFLPYISSKFISKEETISDLVNQLLFITILIIYFSGALLIIFDTKIVLFLYSDKYLQSVSLFFPILVMTILRGMAGILGIILTVSDNQVDRIKSIIFSFIISILANVYLINKFQILGAAYASVITHTVLLLSYIFYSRKVFSFGLLNLKIIIYTLYSISMLFLLTQINQYSILSIFILIFSLIISFVLFRKESKSFILTLNN